MNDKSKAGGDAAFSAPSERQTQGSRAIDRMRLNQKTAYMGKIGRLRERYCLDQMRYMKVCHQKIGQDQMSYVEAKGQTISCARGCSSCCRFVYVGATLQECEAIAYYLWHNEPARNSWLKRFPGWREAVRQGGDTFQYCEQIFSNMLLLGQDRQREKAFDKALRAHNKQRLVCPFLDNDLCLIYEIRPSNCAGFFVTTPPEQCRPTGLSEPKFNITTIDDVVSDVSFYFQSLACPVTLYMPVAVYRIMEEGFAYLSRFPGLDGLESAAMSDPEVQAIIRSSSLE
jgi:Fe-S-cluster containining protein